MSRTPAPVPPARARPSRALLAAASAVAGAAVAAFVAAHLAGRSGPPARAGGGPGDATGAAPALAATSVPRAGPPPAPPAPRPAPSARPAQGPAATPGRAGPEVVARVTRETAERLEATRSELVSRCVPAARRAAEGPGVPFTFHVVFDASGREVGRGVGEDRRRRAPEVARCLRQLPVGTLRVSPPGARVGVRVAMSLP